MSSETLGTIRDAEMNFTDEDRKTLTSTISLRGKTHMHFHNLEQFTKSSFSN